MIVAIVLALAVLMMAVEVARPGRRWPRVRGWWGRAAIINGFQIASVFLAGHTWEGWFRRHQLLALHRFELPVALAIGYAVNVLVLYWLHRARHRVAFLWRWLHQVHHSPQRVELLTAFYKHPLEMVTESIVMTLLLYGVLGLSPRAVLIISIVSATAGLFYHWNVSTPRWLGYLIQRPESHCVHHQTGLHAYNYSELPIVDMLFGTFRNPSTFEKTCGLGPGREEQLGKLLLGQDVGHQDPATTVQA